MLNFLQRSYQTPQQDYQLIHQENGGKYGYVHEHRNIFKARWAFTAVEELIVNEHFSTLSLLIHLI